MFDVLQQLCGGDWYKGIAKDRNIMKCFDHLGVPKKGSKQAPFFQRFESTFHYGGFGPNHHERKVFARGSLDLDTGSGATTAPVHPLGC